MTKKSRFQRKKQAQRKETQEKLKKESEVQEVEEEFVRPLPKGYIPPNKAIVTFRAEDVVVGRSIYNIMEEENAD